MVFCEKNWVGVWSSGAFSGDLNWSSHLDSFFYESLDWSMLNIHFHINWELEIKVSTRNFRGQATCSTTRTRKHSMMILYWWYFHALCINEEELKTLKKIQNWFHAWWIRNQIQDLKKCPHQIKGIPLSQGKTTHAQLVYIIHYSYCHGEYLSIWFENSCLHYKVRKIKTTCFLSKKIPMHL